MCALLNRWSPTPTGCLLGSNQTLSMPIRYSHRPLWRPDEAQRRSGRDTSTEHGCVVLAILAHAAELEPMNSTHAAVSDHKEIASVAFVS